MLGSIREGESDGLIVGCFTILLLVIVVFAAIVGIFGVLALFWGCIFVGVLWWTALIKLISSKME